MKRILYVAIIALGFDLLSSEVAECRLAAASRPSADVFREVWETIREHFFDPNYNGVDWDGARLKYSSRALEATDTDQLALVINKMLSELQTSHTHFYTRADPEYYQLLDLFNRGPLREEIEKLYPGGEIRYTGIGIFTREIDGKTFVSGLLDSHPAARAGLQVGDRILSADGKPFHRIRSFEGKSGKDVRLVIQSDSDPAPAEEVVVVPEPIYPNRSFQIALRESVRTIRRQGFTIGYVHVWSYAGESYHEILTQEIASGRLKDVHALALDLRDGWGGANPNYLNLFNQNVPVLTQTDRSGKAFQYDTQWRKPVALLINGGSRSGKEVFAYGFKKYGLGKVVGARTAGYVTAGRPFILSDGSLLFVAVADVSVDGERLEGKGVSPDVEVAFPIPYARGKDPQLEKAIETLMMELAGTQ